MTEYKLEVILSIILAVNAKNDCDAKEKAIEKFWEIVDEDHKFLEVEVIGLG